MIKSIYIAIMVVGKMWNYNKEQSVCHNITWWAVVLQGPSFGEVHKKTHSKHAKTAITSVD